MEPEKKEKYKREREAEYDKYFVTKEEFIKIKKPASEVTLAQLNHYNNNYREKNIDSTGVISNWSTVNFVLKLNNKGLWPCEEVLAYYLLRNLKDYQGKDVCELGAGFSGLASLMLIRTLLAEGKPFSKYLITDGNEDAVKMLRLNIYSDEAVKEKCTVLNISGEENTLKLASNTPMVTVGKLFWAKDFKSEAKFSRIIIADCLFFEEAHDSLLVVINELLDKTLQDSFCLIVAPNRGKTREKFLEKASKEFSIEEVEFSDEKYKEAVGELEKRGGFDRDKQFPYFLILRCISIFKL